MAPLNISMLRSGRQFAGAGAAGTTEPAPEARLSRNARLELFAEAMLAAAAAPPSPPNPAAVASIINAGMLRSGAQFAAAAGGPAEPTPPTRLSRNARLELFRSKTAAAAAAAAAAGRTTDTAPPPAAVLNLDFLRSGSELKPATAATAPPAEPTAAPSPKLSRAVRLERFHAKSLAAAGTAAGRSAAGRAGPTPTPSTTQAARSVATVVNLDFLRSSAQFKETAASAGSRYELVANVRRAANGAPSSSSKAYRLERFHSRTLRAAGRS